MYSSRLQLKCRQPNKWHVHGTSSFQKMLPYTWPNLLLKLNYEVGYFFFLNNITYLLAVLSLLLHGFSQAAASKGNSLVAVCQLPMVVTSLTVEHGSRARRLKQLWCIDSIVVAREMDSTGSVVLAHRLSSSVAHRIFPYQGWNLCLLHRQAGSLPLSQKGSLTWVFLLVLPTVEETVSQGVWVTPYRSHSQQTWGPRARTCWLQISWSFLHTTLRKNKIQNMRREICMISIIIFSMSTFCMLGPANAMENDSVCIRSSGGQGTVLSSLWKVLCCESLRNWDISARTSNVSMSWLGEGTVAGPRTAFPRDWK